MKTREEQIEKMAKAICATGVALDGTDYAFGVYSDDDHFHKMASALYDAGLKFDTVICHTAEFNHLTAWRMTDLEQRLSSAEHRAEVAERALRKACEHIDGVVETCAVCAKLADKLKVGEVCEVCDRAENCVDNAIKFLTRQAEREIEELQGGER